MVSMTSNLEGIPKLQVILQDANKKLAILIIILIILLSTKETKHRYHYFALSSSSSIIYSIPTSVLLFTTNICFTLHDAHKSTDRKT